MAGWNTVVDRFFQGYDQSQQQSREDWMREQDAKRQMAMQRLQMSLQMGDEGGFKSAYGEAYAQPERYQSGLQKMVGNVFGQQPQQPQMAQVPATAGNYFSRLEEDRKRQMEDAALARRLTETNIAHIGRQDELAQTQAERDAEYRAAVLAGQDAQRQLQERQIALEIQTAADRARREQEELGLKRGQLALTERQLENEIAKGNIFEASGAVFRRMPDGTAQVIYQKPQDVTTVLDYASGTLHQVPGRFESVNAPQRVGVMGADGQIQIVDVGGGGNLRIVDPRANAPQKQGGKSFAQQWQEFKKGQGAQAPAPAPAPAAQAKPISWGTPAPARTPVPQRDLTVNDLRDPNAIQAVKNDEAFRRRKAAEKKKAKQT